MTLFVSTTRRLFLALAIGAPLALAAAPARAAGDIYVHAGANFTPVTIAVTPLAGDEGATKIGAVLGNDLARSIFLTPLDPTTFPEAIANPDVRPNMDAWKTVNAQFVLTGRVSRVEGGHVAAQFRLWDTATWPPSTRETRPVSTNCAFTVFHASIFGRTTGFAVASGNVVGSSGVRKIERAKSLRSTAP